MKTIHQNLTGLLLVAISLFSQAAQAQLVLSQANTTGTYTDPVSITLKPGFSSTSFHGLIQAAAIPLGSSPSPDQNYILTTTYLKPFATAPFDPAVTDAMQTVQYFDGLGRPLQTVQVKATPKASKDVITPFTYDAYGREDRQYLPYATATGVGGAFKTTALTSQAYYYNNNVSSQGQPANAFPYSRTVYEPSPLNRVEQQGFPGAAWQPKDTAIPGSGHTARTEYATNNNDLLAEVATTRKAILYQVSLSSTGVPSLRIGSGTSYGSSQLYVTISKDENWDSTATGFNRRLHTTEEYKDKEDKVILKRTFNLKGSTTEMLSTYYVYDDFGNLTYVLPPGANPDRASLPTGTDLTNWLKTYVYQYRYDERNRMVGKKVPGKGWEYTVYNKLDQAILTQDSLSRAAHQWLYVKYDALGRTASSGIHSSAAGRQAMQDSANASTVLWETRSPGTASYSSQAFPKTGLSLRSANYYDDYTFSGATTSTLQPSGITKSSMTQGLLTCTRTYRTDGSGPLISIYYYDDKGRVIQTASQNHLGGTDVTTNTYNFTDQVTRSVRVHKASSTGTATTIATSYAYDHMGRLDSTREKINSEAEVLLSKNTYNEVGQLRSKGLHSTDNGTNYLATITYDYNERGWLKKQSSGQFTEELRYQDGSIPQYNGNISNQLWSTTGTIPASNPGTFTYQYDALNRLTSGVSTGVSPSMGEVLTYDVMGNIKTLKRDAGAVTTYNYTSGNRLANTTGGLVTGTYVYNGNGNATTDGRTGMDFTYNYLDLPQTASKSGTSLTYLYDATGKKLRKTATAGSTTTQRDYIDGIEYNKIGTAATAIDIIRTAEGYALKNGSTFVYHYNLTDHLGNVRATIKKGTSALEVVQRDDYYPFGLEKVVLGGTNKYLYNGKELQDELGQYDYGARLYDPVIGRWGVVDPLAEQGRRWSPYTYVFNNPLRFVDPDGMEGDDWIKDRYGNFLWDDQAVDQSTTRQGWTYVGKDLPAGAGRLNILEEIGGQLYHKNTGNLLNALGNMIFGEGTFTEKKPYDPVDDEFIGEAASTAASGLAGAGIGKVISGAAPAIKGLFSSGAGKEIEEITKAGVSGSQYSVAFETELASGSYPGVYRGAHFLEANKALSATMEADAEFASSMSELGITIPRSSTGSIVGKSPSGWVWHHDINQGIMQLVPKAQHTIGSQFWNTLHPGGIGGFAIWGK